MPSLPPWLLVPAALVGFVGFFAVTWTLVSAILATAAGWATMASRYLAPPGLRGTPLPSGWANHVGAARYRGVLSFEATPEGLLVRVMRLFPFHPPLLLPWHALTLSSAGGIGSTHTLTHSMTVTDGATFSLNREAFDAIQRAQDHATSTRQT